MTALAYVVCGLVTWRLYRLATVDAITDNLRQRLANMETEGRRRLDQHRTPHAGQRFAAWVNEGLSCPWCASVWFATPTAVGAWYGAPVAGVVWWWVVSSVLVSSMVCGVCESLWQRYADETAA